MATTSRQMSIDEQYLSTREGSLGLYVKAKEVFPSGVTHDARFLEPFPLYITRALGSHKWDVDGNEYIDFWAGHGSLMLGHSRPELVDATVRQMALGTHYGACQELEVRWGQLVCQMVPCAERVKFVGSGTEATMMAMRLARGFTGRTKVLKFEGHFHGWHDYVTVGVAPPFEVPTSVGVPKEVLSTMVVSPHGDLAAVLAFLKSGDVAAVILEPSGAIAGQAPLPAGFLQGLRSATKDTGTVLIFDEVVTGFRQSAGGAQEYYGVTPDLCTMAKALVGGLPSGAVAGKKDIMSLLEFGLDAKRNRFGRVAHPGTFNANPLAASMAVANLTILSQDRDSIYPHTYRLGASLRAGINEAIKRQGLPGCAYGDTSFFKLAVGEAFADLTEDKAMSGSYDLVKLLTGVGPMAGKLRRAMILEGVDLPGAAGMVTAAHTVGDIDRAVEAFDHALARLKAEGAFERKSV